LSDDGRYGLTLIAFIGSVFSPYYAWAGWADPLDHCAVNVALYGATGKRWAMTERGRKSLRRTASTLAIGPSSLLWEDGVLTIDIDEVTAPAPSRIRGTIRLRPRFLNAQAFALDPAQRHGWRPIAPRADVEVSLQSPGCAWRGEGYFDTNAGDEPLQDRFTGWNWSRAHLPSRTVLFYDVEGVGGERTDLALRFGPDGSLESILAPPPAPLPSTFWRVGRTARGDAHDPPTLGRTLEDTPFYSRSVLEGRYGGEPAQIVHESLSARRLRSPVVRAMLPFKMPRVFF
jgi:carotenoid 1,2-hydratase